jgi:predicted nucleic acid-binding protein
VFCDTSVLVAALDGAHLAHDPCISLLGRLKKGEAHCALHSYAEFYAVLSRKPGIPRLRTTDVDLMLERLGRVFTPVSLTRREYRQVIHSSAQRGVAGGRLYDALILACAVKIDASDIYTLNEKDFKALAPVVLQPRIRRP